VTTAASALFTDLYELTMAQAYWAEGMHQPAVFELAFRSLPPNRNYIVAAGLADVVEYLEGFRFTPDEIAHLRRLGGFQEDFLAWLEQLRFTGEVWAVPEGTLVFPDQPLVQVIAPVIQAQLAETYILNQVHLQSVAATKALRVVTAAAGRPVVDFGSRRAHGTDAALKVARATWLAGGAGTSNVLAGRMYGIPVFGTMAHSYIQAHQGDREAFENFTALYPGTTLLVDTYDTLAGVREVIGLKRRLGAKFQVRAIRLDSGDLGALAFQARKMLDQAGLRDVGIFASSGLDEYQVQALVAQGAPIDAFGVGTKMAVAADAPDLDMAYKLVEYAGRGRIKLSSRKLLYPGRKQVFRKLENGRMVSDTVGRFDQRLPGEPLLEPLLAAMPGPGRRARVRLEDSRERCRRELERLPEELRRLEQAAPPYPVRISPALQADLDAVRARVRVAARS
jgi:nicotinate phosphoribosyltransferase